MPLSSPENLKPAASGPHEVSEREFAIVVRHIASRADLGLPRRSVGEVPAQLPIWFASPNLLERLIENISKDGLPPQIPATCDGAAVRGDHQGRPRIRAGMVAPFPLSGVTRGG